MKRGTIVALLLGSLLLLLALAWQGVTPVLTALKTVGARVLLLPLYSLIPLSFAVLSWSTLFRERRQPFTGAIYPAITGLAINWLLPAAQIGGELARLHIGVQRGQDPAEACAAAVVDKTMQLLTQVVFTLLGLGLLVWHFTTDSAGVAMAAGSAAFAGIVAAAWWIQRQGFFNLLFSLGRRFKDLPETWNTSADRLDEAVHQLHARPSVVWRCAAHRMTFRLLMVGETWLALRFIGAGAGFTEALVLESAAQAIRVGAFFIPAGLGAQEGGLAALGALMGLGPDQALAAGLCKRVRELAIGLPFLWFWQADQARRLLGNAGR